MTKLIRNLSLVAFILSFTISCSKSGDVVAPITKTVQIAAKPWKYKDAGIDLDANGTIDQALPAGSLAACQTDFLLTFKADKTGVFDEGPTKCLSTDPQTNSFTWDFANDEKELTFSQSIIPGFGGNTKIIELSDTKLTLSKSVSISGIPIPINVTVLLEH